MDEARDLYKRQEKVARNTKRAAGREERQRQELLEKEMKEQFDRIRELAGQFRTTVDQLATRSFPSYAEDSLAELQEHAISVIQALDVQRLKGALDSARAAEGNLLTLRSYARMNRGINSPEEMVRLAMAQDVALIRAIEELLKNVQESLNQDAEGKSMEELRQSQQALAESARRLREMMNQKNMYLVFR